MYSRQSTDFFLNIPYSYVQEVLAIFINIKDTMKIIQEFLDIQCTGM